MPTQQQIDDAIAVLSQVKPPYLKTYENFVPGKDFVQYSGQWWDQSEMSRALETFIKGSWITSGEQVASFQDAFAKKYNTRYAHMVNSGSSANLVMITALKKHLKWEDGDEVIVSPVGLPTTIAPLIQNNLKPVFVDIELYTLNFDVDSIESKITDRTRAIFVSPVLGNPPDMDYIQSLCWKYNIELIGDNCDSLGTTINGNSITDYYYSWSCSFYPAHHISTGEGGMVCSNDEEFIKTARSISWWGRDCYCVGSNNTSFTFYNNGTSYFNGAVTIDDTATFTAGNQLQFYTSNGNLRGYINATDTDDNHLQIATSGGEDIVFKDAGLSGTRNLVIRGGNTGTEAYGSMRSPIFYDSQDASYYVDPNGTSRVTNMNIQGNCNVDTNFYSVAVYNNPAAVAANVVVLSSANSWQFRRATSSIRYKKDVETIQDQYADAILNCRPVWFRSTCEGHNPDYGYWGFIAEEVAEVDPRLVFFNEVEKNGETILEPDGVQYGRFVPLLLHHIKKLYQENENLKLEIQSIKDQLNNP